MYSAGTAATVLLCGRASWFSVAGPPGAAAATATLLPDAIVCVSAGFIAFHLWALVYYRCAIRMPGSTPATFSPSFLCVACVRQSDSAHVSLCHPTDFKPTFCEGR